MLSIKDISNRIENTHLITPNDLDLLRGYSENVPYCHIYSILYLKGLSINHDVRFDQELNAHSYRITDRAQLYQLIQEKETILDSQEIVKASIKEVAKEVIDEIQAEEPATLITKTSGEIEISELPKEIEISPTGSTETETINLDNVEKSILQHAYSANYALSELNEEEKNALEEKNISSENSDKNEQLIAPKKEEIEFKIDTKQSFNSWLNSNQNYIEITNTDKSSIQYIVENQEVKTNPKDLFGRVEKPKKEFFSPIKKAKESLQEDQLPVSETLAKIYALQGNFPKAISAYNQLCLKYPEKKIFFAVQIKELEKKINK